VFRGGIITLSKISCCHFPPHGRFGPRSGTETVNVADHSVQTTVGAISPLDIGKIRLDVDSRIQLPPAFYGIVRGLYNKYAESGLVGAP
jgi:hypothetical protein